MSLATDLDLARDNVASDGRMESYEGHDDDYERPGLREADASELHPGHERLEGEELAADEGEDYEQEVYDERHPFYAQPTTLLAELQLRKLQQKSRNRTAATAFPNGMHSTLLELDAVAQVEKAKRQGQRTRLAWEDPSLKAQDDQREDEDEDVPLGVLYPTKTGLVNRIKGGTAADWDRPLGLIERREMEDNEPLSRRRNRLRGVSPERALRAHAQQQRQEQLLYEAQAANAQREQGEPDADEPLAQRLQRPWQKKALDGALGDVADESKDRSVFADELLGQLDIKDGSKTPEPAITETNEETPRAKPVEQGEEEEETLGQRRARLQREREANPQQGNVSDNAPPNTARPNLRPSASMANLLTPNPISAPATGVRPTNAPAAGTLLAASAAAEERDRMQLRAQNMRATSHGVLPQTAMAASKSMPNGLPSAGFPAVPQFNNVAQQNFAPMAPGAQVYPANMNAGMGMGMGYGQMNPLAYQQFAAPAYGGMQMGMGYPGVYGQMSPQWQMAMQNGQMAMMFDEPMDPRQRALIDRWRLSVAQ